ncbi:MAG: tripartite tricarboxylate transporter TctA family protein, partial [Tissierellia bacterium]|nr:tripartite tricarboxylate transporter TctA family protein [Tissierellia bacterium]
LNPFRILNRMEMIGASISALIANFLFVLSPVGLTILLGEAAANRVEDPVEKGFVAITAMSALIQATYISGIIIPLTAIGIPLSPTAIGPGGALFNAPPVFTVDNNLYHRLNKGEFIIGILLGATIAIIISYYIINRFAGRITTFVLRRIPHEAILALFISLIILLAYMDAGLINVFGVLLIGITCGTLNRMGMGYGVQFMTLYAAPWIIEKITLF